MTIVETLRTRIGLIALKPMAQIIGSHYQTLYGRVREGAIPYTRVGSRIRFDPGQVADWLESRQIG